MSYSVYFFAMDAKSVAQQFCAEPKLLLEPMEQRIRDEQAVDEQDMRTTLAKGAAICAGNLPNDCDEEYFDALCWLGEVVGEKVNIPSFNDCKAWFLDDIGIWPWLWRSPPPFAVPVCSDPSPEVGFLSVQDMERFAMPAFHQLPAKKDPEVEYARQEFQEVLETLIEDKLDLLAIMI